MIQECHSELRKQLIAIRDDPSTSSNKKSRLSQELLMRKLSAGEVPANNYVHNCNVQCEHYSKTCSQFKFECCQVIDPCHRCHLARGCDIRPPAVSSIVCNYCDVRQEPSAACISCGVQFSNSYCDKCKIWTAAEITHCEHCGFCRVGSKDAVFHCFTCDACFSVEGKERHRCAKSKLKDSLCPLCLDSVHTAQKASNILPCGHVLHTDCWRSAALKGEYRCPTCRKSLADMKNVWLSIKRSIQLQPIPRGMFPLRVGDTVKSPYGNFLLTNQQPHGMWKGRLVDWKLTNNAITTATLHESLLEKNRKVRVWCFDCESKSYTEFHFLGLECTCCGGFNTCQE